MLLVVPRYPSADLEQFPDDGNRYELPGGGLLVTPAPGPPPPEPLGLDLHFVFGPTREGHTGG